MISFNEVTLRYPRMRQSLLPIDHPKPVDAAIIVNLTYEIPNGSLVLLCGESGSGKSLLIESLLRNVSPDSGNIAVGGRDISGLSGSALAKYRNSLGVVHPGFQLLADRTIRENIELPMEIEGASAKRIRARVEHVAAEFGINNLLSAFPSQLSLSERQQVLIARAVVTEPLLLLADDPTAHLDAMSASAIAELLTVQNTRGMTVVVATNDPRLIAQLPQSQKLDLAKLATGVEVEL